MQIIPNSGHTNNSKLKSNQIYHLIKIEYKYNIFMGNTIWKCKNENRACEI